MGFWKTLEKGTGDIAQVAGYAGIAAGVATGNPAIAKAGAAGVGVGKAVNDNVGKPMPVRAPSLPMARTQQASRMSTMYPSTP